MTKQEFGTAILEYNTVLRGYARSLTKHNKDDADDLVQDTYFKALLFQDKFDGINLKAWLCTIMKNTFKAMHKRIELFTFTYNDEDLLPFFLHHYAPLVDRMTIMDSGSTDRTLEIIKIYQTCFNINVIQTGLTWWDWDAGHIITCNIWRGSEYDLIMLPDVDEIFYRPDLRAFLDTNNFAIYQLEGYQMVSRTFPKPGTALTDIKVGTPIRLYNKFTIFKPTADIRRISNHEIAPTKEVICRGQIKLLHYKFVGVDFLLKRAALIKSRVPADSYCPGIKANILKKYPGFVRTRAEYTQEIEELLKQAKPVIP